MGGSTVDSSFLSSKDFTDSGHGVSRWTLAAATIAMVWYVVVLSVSGLGYNQLRRYYFFRLPPAVCTTLPLDKVPHLTILRPVKSPEPYLYECLAASFRQTYPAERLTIYLCIDSSHDPAFPILQQLLADFPNHDARILVADEDPYPQAPGAKLGPNPKIRNLSRGYREAKGDIVWVLDCNIWVTEGAAGRMVDKLCGLEERGEKGRKYKFVHHLPLVINVQEVDSCGHNQGGSFLRSAGGRLEEMFMASAHAKFYTAINTVLLAPCIIGKSNMFRRSHLNYLTADVADRAPGIDSFSDNICEDHLIGDLLWKKKVAGEEQQQGERWGKHALVFGELAIQPMAAMSLGEYIARRVRWLRVRKYTVTLATLVEPGTESLLCSVYGAYAITVFSRSLYGIQSPRSWMMIFLAAWLCSVTIWAFVDWNLYLILHSASSVEVNMHTPLFVRQSPSRIKVKQWIWAWLGREALALPIWLWAVYGGATVEWRRKRFWVGMDMKVHALHENQRHMADDGKRRRD
ncbi:MAG: hypothetical protein M1816_003694 [Peltula sp. TS41687]|nr:MAG: hypothetical protein M1816_003694 [Peltula sp. TS41687]